MKQIFKKVVTKKQDKTKQTTADTSKFDADSATLVNVPIRSGLVPREADVDRTSCGGPHPRHITDPAAAFLHGDETETVGILC